MLTEIRVPKLGAWTGWSYLKFTRRAQDWATVGVAALVRRDNGDVDDARIALTNMGADAAAGERGGAGASSPATRIRLRSMAEGTEPPTDTGASAEFRSHLAACHRPAGDRGGDAQVAASARRTITTPGSSTYPCFAFRCRIGAFRTSFEVCSVR